jgi:hypothetical protein
VVTPEENTKAGLLVDLLQVAADVSRLAEGEKYVTLSAVPWQVHRMLEATKVVSTDRVFTKTIKDALRKAIKKRLGFVLKEVFSLCVYPVVVGPPISSVLTLLFLLPSQVNLALVASALDPRFGHLDFIQPRLANLVWDKVLDLLTDFCSMSFAPSNTQLQNEEAGTTMPPQPIIGSAHYQPILASLREFFESKPYAGRSKVDPLKEWKSYTGWYNSLKVFVRLIFAIPATSASSERAFSKAGRHASKFRNRLSVDALETYVVTKSILNEMAMSPGDVTRDLIASMGNQDLQ